MKKLLLVFFLGICLISANGNHIVGGEIEFLYLSNGIYRLNVIQYFDEVQNANPGPDYSITVHIFRNSDDALMSTHVLFLDSQKKLDYTNIACTRDELATSKILWTSNVNLNPAEYADEEGYYIVWERCCRNFAVKNIENSGGTGMKYVLEIPPLMKEGQIFVNSSPVLFKPLSSYACINQLYYIEFTGTDPDGDSLVYSLVTPLNSSGVVAVPTPTPKPHINVAFASGYSETNMIPGSPALAISHKGLLTVTPEETGLYVFSVLVKEYRGNEKIGQTRRDFQMLVIDGCQPPDPPVVDIDIPGNSGFNPVTDTLVYTVAEAKCFEFLVSNVTPGDSITLRAEGVNFDDNFDDIFKLNQIPVGSSDSELRVEVCIPECPPIRGEPFILNLIANDNACPLPQLDTLRMMIEVEPPPNVFPTYTTSTKSVVQPEGNDPVYLQNVSGTDADLDEMSIAMFINGVNDPIRFGFNLEVTSNVAGAISATISWDTDCTLFDFADTQDFMIGVVIDDNDDCSIPNPDTLFIDSKVILSPNNNPIVSSGTVIPNQVEVGSLLDFDVSVTDSDGDYVTLIFVGANFNPDQYGVAFLSSNGIGTSTSSFSWDLSCNASLYKDGQQFELLFIGDDDDKCKVKNFDTLRSVIQVNYPFNNNPEFESIAQHQIIKVNENTRIEIEAFDLNSDEIILSFADGIRQPASGSLAFESVTGTGRVSSFLEWQPECSLLRFGESSTLQDVIFQVVDSACPISKMDTLKITFEIVDDMERQREFKPPNVFTPNGDGVNDTFQLNGNPDSFQNLPANNCDNSFEYVVINNRAGNTVFRNEKRDFVWTGGEFPSGVYYYLIKYTNTEFKGYIHLLR